ncbi:MAG: DciA family protein [Steroidobacteraceae bacterium]|jgi:hypothetical protein
MPKTRGRHKQTGAQSRNSGSPRYGKPGALADLLARPASPLATLRARARAAEDWLTLVRSWLPADTASRVTSAVEREGRLTVYVASATWAARLHFEVEALLTKVREQNGRIAAVQVKVLPPSRAGLR